MPKVDLPIGNKLYKICSTPNYPNICLTKILKSYVRIKGLQDFEKSATVSDQLSLQKIMLELGRVLKHPKRGITRNHKKPKTSRKRCREQRRSETGEERDKTVRVLWHKNSHLLKDGYQSFMNLIISFGVQSKMLHSFSNVYIVIDLLCFKLLMVRGLKSHLVIKWYVVIFFCFMVSQSGS